MNELSPEENGAVHKEARVAVAKWGAPLVALLLIVGSIGGTLLYVELAGQNADTRRLAQQTKDILARLNRSEASLAKERVIVRSKFRQADLSHCREIEKLKEGFREAAKENFAMLERNAALLKIEVTPALRAAAREGLRKTLKRYAPRKGGCRSLPSLIGN